MDELLEAMKLLGFEDTPTNYEQFGVLVMAMKKFVERNAKYKDLWKEYGAEDNLLHITSKAARIKRLHGEGDLDDAIDLINYSVFYIRNVDPAMGG